MKKLLIIIAIAILPTFLYAQNDWPNYEKYMQQNATISVQPKAIFIGDSIVEGWTNANNLLLTKHGIIGRGISGQVTSQMLLRFRQDVVALFPKYVIILAGTNDIAGNYGPIGLGRIFNNIVSMCDLAKANKIKPIICSVLPASGYDWNPDVKDAAEQIMTLNAMLKEYAKANSIKYLDFHSVLKDGRNGLQDKYTTDGVHLTNNGYQAIEKILVRSIR